MGEYTTIAVKKALKRELKITAAKRGLSMAKLLQELYDASLRPMPGKQLDVQEE